MRAAVPIAARVPFREHPLVWSYLRRRFVAGFFVTVPLALSLAALVWIFGVADALTSPLVERAFGRRVPGLGIAATAVGILVVGFFAANVVGRRLLQRAEYYLMLVPLFRSIYAPVKQLVWAFNPQNDSGFKRVVLVEEPQRGMVLGFLTRELTVPDEAGQPEAWVAVYVPTNHLYLGDILLYRRARVRFPDLSVEEGVRVFLTGGMALPPAITAPRTDQGEARRPPSGLA
ncbi:hypothetical protein TBR22_A48170 [Luteitalea sp. TBR-22]|uniref:DUF502 domain-containing protein n=1 Tax=Luteitalea sp. TBR-22 TaxID=2802971 RepID=UPI001AF4FAC6|nr:DUF502 domain-containing protein [Luteitalea sp. TBR-22]BCS35583.1 hypothetical protein TBR22_A48170 [Luteitalea sp. TBR-22]